MKKGLYITTRSLERIKTKETGIFNKITSQYNVFDNEFEMKLLSFTKLQFFVSVFISRLPINIKNICWKIDKEAKNVDFIYWRFEGGNISVVKMVEKIKSENPACKIIVEFPTFPIDWGSFSKERQKSKKKYDECIDKIKMIADRCVVYGEHEDAFGIKAIKTQNGIDINKIRPRKLTHSDSIRLISVSKMVRWHRIDRLINGIADYYENGGKEDIQFRIVGSGAEEAALRQLVTELNLEKNVHFEGYKSGEALDDIFDNSDLAVDGLTEIPKQNSSLKSREYWAKGMPIITSNMYSNETKHIEQYILYVPANEINIEIEDIIRFHDCCNNNCNKESVNQEIRKFAIENYDISVSMRPIINCIYGGEE